MKNMSWREFYVINKHLHTVYEVQIALKIIYLVNLLIFLLVIFIINDKI